MSKAGINVQSDHGGEEYHFDEDFFETCKECGSGERYVAREKGRAFADFLYSHVSGSFMFGFLDRYEELAPSRFQHCGHKKRP